ncbi:putative bifunctional diguanylate cyclase/phosphodiesterase [Saccharothrix sp. Mg75]|uniref:putative bifunctional diguanylate cyclase/phosphodiesterase n=1 Tax=Saccharothrix sp. Mg75 TaxID=3445357 RepID=UPI003EEA90B5
MVEQEGAAAPREGHGNSRADFARRWAAAIGSTVMADLPRPRLEELLAGFTDVLLAALDDDGPTAPVQRVGRGLVEHGLVSTTTLEHTVEFIGTHLPAAFDLPAGRTGRLAAVLGALAAGFGDGLRVHTLDQQEKSARHALIATRSAESAVRASEAKFRAVFHSTAVAISVTSLDGKVLDCNEAMLSMIGYSADQVVGTDAGELLHPDDRETLRRGARQLAAGLGEHVRTEVRLVDTDGEEVPVLVAMSLVRDDLDEPAYYVTMMENLDELRALQAQLLRQSLNDVQTGLANRAQFVGWLEKAAGSRGPATLGLVVFDVDGFRVVNDAFGHDVGNRVLGGIAKQLRSVFDGRGHVARIGPDEFGVLLHDPADVATVVTLAEEALELLAEPVWVGDDGVGVTASVGVVVAPARGADAAELLRSVDMTVRWAKDGGKAQWALYDRERDRRDRRRMRLAASISGGLEQGDFRVDYEPVHSPVDRSLLAVEATLRWDHPTEGLLDPRDLLSLSTSTGMVVRLGRWAMEQACFHAGQWYAEFGDRAPLLTMDLTARQCQEPELVAEVRRVLRESGLPAERLQLELGEQLPALITDEQAEELTFLAEHGVRLVLDQVGGGNLPVDRLRRFPLSGMKFQGSPVAGLAEGANRFDESAAVALLTWAASLGMPLYAAGVTSETVAARLAELGVTGVQGPLFGDGPLTAEDVTAILGKS